MPHTDELQNRAKHDAAQGAPVPGLNEAKKDAAKAKAKAMKAKEEKALAKKKGKNKPICKICDRKFFIKSMVHESSMMIKAQNLTIENALRQTRERKNDISDTVLKNREYFDN